MWITLTFRPASCQVTSVFECLTTWCLPISPMFTVIDRTPTSANSCARLPQSKFQRCFKIQSQLTTWRMMKVMKTKVLRSRYQAWTTWSTNLKAQMIRLSRQQKPCSLELLIWSNAALRKKLERTLNKQGLQERNCLILISRHNDDSMRLSCRVWSRT